jgi:hypothetical protein
MDDVLAALSEGWREIVADSEGYGANYFGVCPDCVKDGSI